MGTSTFDVLGMGPHMVFPGDISVTPASVPVPAPAAPSLLGI